MTELFWDTHKACSEDFLKYNTVPYHRRAELDAAAKIVTSGDGFTSHGQFHFYYSVFLFIKCAERTFPIWEKIVPNSRLELYKDMIMKGVEHEINNSEIQQFYDRCQSDIQNLIYDWNENEIDQAGAAGPSCLTAISQYLGHFRFATNVKNEQDIDIYYWDSAFYSSVAVAGGAEWQCDEKALDVEARSDFWRWYIKEATQQAYNEAYQVAFAGL